jgi:PAS domain S-box-containing protein
MIGPVMVEKKLPDSGDESEGKRIHGQPDLFGEHERLQNILDSFTDGVFTIDLEWRITLFNRAAERITGNRADEVLGQLCKDVFWKGFRQNALCRERCPMKRTLEGRGPIHEERVEVFDKLGHRLILLVTTSILRDRFGDPVGGVEIFKDITEVEQLREQLEGRARLGNLVGKSPPMQSLFHAVEEIAPTDATVLLCGETGTGKDLLAQAIHFLSQRREGSFVKVNCAALPENLLESELFGYMRGAFTGAVRDRAGRFEKAHEGTLFLDEVGELSIPMQAKLLRVLEEKCFERLGENRTREVDVRILAATNQDLHQAIQQGRFREDLFYRLSVIPLLLPSLAERLEDIPLLVDFFLERLKERYHKAVQGLSADALKGLLAYRWPGNVRELEHVLERAYILSQGQWIRRSDLVMGPGVQMSRTAADENEELSLGSGERSILEAAMRRFRWNRSEAAAHLGISRSTLWRKMKKHGLT